MLRWTCWKSASSWRRNNRSANDSAGVSQKRRDPRSIQDVPPNISGSPPGQACLEASTPSVIRAAIPRATVETKMARIQNRTACRILFPQHRL